MLRYLPSYLIPNFDHINKPYNSKKKKSPKKESKCQRTQIVASCCMTKNFAKNTHSSSAKCKKHVWFPRKKRQNSGNVEEIGKFIRKVMLHFDLPTSIIHQIIHKMNSVVKCHVKDATSKLSKYYEKENKILKEEYGNKETEFKQKLIEIDKFLNDETKKIEKEHRKLVSLTENMLSNEKKLAEKTKEVENKLKRMNELEKKLAEEITKCSKIKINSPVQQQLLVPPIAPCKMKHCDKQCEENKKELEELKIQKNGFENIVENQNVVIANLTAKSNIMYKQLQEGKYTIEELKGQLAKQIELLKIERQMRRVNSDRTSSSSEVLTVGTDGEGDHNAEDSIKQSHMKLEQLEKESAEIERKFKQFQLTLRNT